MKPIGAAIGDDDVIELTPSTEPGVERNRAREVAAELGRDVLSDEDREWHVAGAARSARRRVTGRTGR